MEISVIPVGSKTTSISDYVAEAVRVLEKEGVKYEVTAMGTIVEGELKELFQLAEKMHRAVFRKGAVRVITSVKIDDRRDKTLSVKSKVEAVKEKL